MSTEMLRTVLILREWDEAWTHSRHLEDLRRHYLSFFFTALLGVTAFSASYLARRQLSPSGSVVTISALGLCLQMLSAYLYLAIHRVNVVLDHYLEVVGKIRDQLRLDGSSPVDLGEHRHIPLPQREERLGRLILWHGSEALLVLAAGIFGAILTGNVIRAALLAEVSSISVIISACAVVLGVWVCLFVYWLLHPSSWIGVFTGAVSQRFQACRQRREGRRRLRSPHQR
jgi:hypothetical protein